MNLRHPVDPLGCVQLHLRLRLLERIYAVHDAQLDDHRTGETVAGAEQGRAAVAAEVARDRVAAVARLGDGLGRAGYQLEGGFGDADVRAVGRAADFTAVEAVAEGLGRGDGGC